MGVQLVPSSREYTAPVGPTATTVGRLARGTYTPPHTPVRSGGRERATQLFPPSLVVAASTSLGCAAPLPPNAMPLRSSLKAIDCGPTPARVVIGSVSTDQLR